MVNLIQVSKVEKKLRGNNFQIKKPSYEEIDKILDGLLDSLIESVQSEGIKSIGVEDVQRLLRPAQKKSSDVLANIPCSRCSNLKKPFLEFAKKLQVFTIDEAKIMAGKYT